MNRLDLPAVIKYIQENISPGFHDKKISKLKKLTLDDIIRRKNPYLFKAKHTNSAAEFIKSVLDATVSSGEETVFGNFFENIAIFVCQAVYGGRKSSAKGIDLEFENKGTKYLVSIKSGPNWGNSSQIANLIKMFASAKKTLATSGGSKGVRIVCIEGCCYGIDNVPDKGTHRKLCGEQFWDLISGGSKSLYRDIIEPLGYKAKEKNDELELKKTAKLNTFTSEFVQRFCNKGMIDWDLLIRFNSGKNREIESKMN